MLKFEGCPKQQEKSPQWPIKVTPSNDNLTLCFYHVMYEFQTESTLYSLPECQGTPCLKQVPYLKFKWQQRDSNPQPLSS